MLLGQQSGSTYDQYHVEVEKSCIVPTRTLNITGKDDDANNVVGKKSNNTSLTLRIDISG